LGERGAALPLGVTEDSSRYDEEGRSANTIFLFTERGVYKPGDTLYLKGYAQDFATINRVSLPASASPSRSATRKSGRS
jgi:uncharacterized protein YfaS (alpha-2-macroglobulin family)